MIYDMIIYTFFALVGFMWPKLPPKVELFVPKVTWKFHKGKKSIKNFCGSGIIKLG